MLVPKAQAHRSTETMQEFTNYHFDVKPNALYGALDRFAQFFIDPLCKADALEREVVAVDNEFSGKAPSTYLPIVPTAPSAVQSPPSLGTSDLYARSHKVLTLVSGPSIIQSYVMRYRSPTE